MREWMNYLKEKIEQGKQDAFVWYSVASRWFMMGNIFLYVAACIIAGGMVGPVRYVEFLNNACHFGQAAQVAQVAVAPKPDEGQRDSVPTDSPHRHKAPVLDPNASF